MYNARNMPIYGLRFKEGLNITGKQNPTGEVYDHLDEARKYLYRPGRHDVTPSNFLWPSSRHLLLIDEDLNGIYYAAPADKNTRVFDAEEIDKLAAGQIHTRAHRQKIDESEPILIVKPELRKGEQQILLLLVILSAPQAIFMEFEEFIPEPRRDIVVDAQNILRKAKNNTLPEAKLVEALIKLDPFYKNRRLASFQGVLDEMVRFGHLQKITKANYQLYTLPK